MGTSTNNLLEEIKVRRSTYTLSPESTLSEARIKEILETTLEEAPSTFGSYTTRLVLVVKEEHKRLWSIITDVIKAITPPEKFEGYTKQRLEGFANAYGTSKRSKLDDRELFILMHDPVLFFEDPENTKQLQEKFEFAKDKFPVWAQHTSAIHQFIIWTALANAGLGANLQHYNPVIGEKVQEAYKVPKEWQLVAQLVFGKPTAPAGPKSTGMKKPLSERLFVHGA